MGAGVSLGGIGKGGSKTNVLGNGNVRYKGIETVERGRFGLTITDFGVCYKTCDARDDSPVSVTMTCTNDRTQNQCMEDNTRDDNTVDGEDEDDDEDEDVLLDDDPR